MIDNIVNARTNEIYAEVEVHRDDSKPFLYTAAILRNAIPAELSELIRERDELVRLVSIPLLDQVEGQLEEYALRLERMGERIFAPTFDGEARLTFFTRFPTATGFATDESS